MILHDCALYHTLPHQYSLISTPAQRITLNTRTPPTHPGQYTPSLPPGAVLEEVSHMEVAPSDMKRLMEGQLGTTVPQRHSLDGGEGQDGDGGDGVSVLGGKRGEQGKGTSSATGMRITGDEETQVFVVRYVGGCVCGAVWVGGCVGSVDGVDNHYCAPVYCLSSSVVQGGADACAAVAGAVGGPGTGVCLLFFCVCVCVVCGLACVCSGFNVPAYVLLLVCGLACVLLQPHPPPIFTPAHRTPTTQGLIVFWYTYFVDVAPPHSWQIRLFSYLANGPGRNAMLQLFADSGNFSRRLLSIKANGKFSAPDASPEMFFKVGGKN